MIRTYKKMEVNTAVLNKWLEDNGKTYAHLASDAGISPTLAHKLTKKSGGGNQAIAQLVGLKIPHLFQLVTYEVQNRKTRIVTKQNMIIAIVKGENNG